MIKFNVASINTCTETEGPYKRLTIWFQGCNMHCDGCCNPNYQAIVAKHIMTLEELLSVIVDAKNVYGIEGVTYSGGEPTLQKNLPELTYRIKQLGLGVISFTGYKFDDVKDTLSGCDVVIDGRFEKNDLETNRRLLGSNNQRIICLTKWYESIIYEWFNNSSKAVEVNVGTSINFNGDKI